MSDIGRIQRLHGATGIECLWLIDMAYARLATLHCGPCALYHGRGNRGITDQGGQMTPPPEIYLRVKHGILTPQTLLLKLQVV